MKKIVAASIMAMALVTGASADVKVGLGYTFTDGLIPGVDAEYVVQPANIRVPIDFDSGLRLEPELAYGVSSNETVDGLDEYEKMTIAFGVYQNVWKVEKVNFYAGGRLAISKEKKWISAGGTTVTTTTDNTSLQGLFGAEYMFTQDFSFGAQVGLEYQAGTTGDLDTDSFGTVSHLLIHYFF